MDDSLDVDDHMEVDSIFTDNPISINEDSSEYSSDKVIVTKTKSKYYLNLILHSIPPSLILLLGPNHYNAKLKDTFSSYTCEICMDQSLPSTYKKKGLLISHMRKVHVHICHYCQTNFLNEYGVLFIVIKCV